MSEIDNLPLIGTADEVLMFMKNLHDNHDTAALADLDEDTAVIYAVDGGRMKAVATTPYAVYREIHDRQATPAS